MLKGEFGHFFQDKRSICNVFRKFRHIQCPKTAEIPKPVLYTHDTGLIICPFFVAKHNFI